jgi:hypothetical protein
MSPTSRRDVNEDLLRTNYKQEAARTWLPAWQSQYRPSRMIVPSWTGFADFPSARSEVPALDHGLERAEIEVARIAAADLLGDSPDIQPS